MGPINHTSLKSFKDQGYKRVPLVREVSADLDSPLSLYLKCADGPYTYLFESLQGGEKWGRYSIIGLACSLVIRVNEHRLTVTEQGKVTTDITLDDPLAWIEDYQQQRKAPVFEDLPIFNGGLVGYFGYDTIRYIEPRLDPCPNLDDVQNPDILLMESNELVVFDNISAKVHIIVLIDPDNDHDVANAELRMQAIAEAIHAPLPYPPPLPPQNTTKSTVQSNVDIEDYKACVDKARQYIVDGDAMQIVYSQRLQMPFTARPFELYRSLRRLNPSPYMYYLNLDDLFIVGSSPEILVRVDNSHVSVRPIAGTRKRGDTEEQDLALEQDLLSDQKELAEHLMLIDLGRNDIGRVAEIGSVKLTEKMLIERYSHVMHIVSNVEGTLRKDKTAIDALRATFPAGTLSGAPKIRAMEIIDELETTKRGVYGGAVGYFAFNGNLDTAIAIRTGVIKNNTLYIQAGGGIVYDSVPQSEWEESMNKAKAVVLAAELVVKRD